MGQLKDRRAGFQARRTGIGRAKLLPNFVESRFWLGGSVARAGLFRLVRSQLIPRRPPERNSREQHGGGLLGDACRSLETPCFDCLVRLHVSEQ